MAIKFTVLTTSVLIWHPVCLGKLLRDTNCDTRICIISEHKLKNESLHHLSTIEHGYRCIGHVGKADVLSHNYNGYGKGGIAILYKCTLQFSVHEIYDTYSERIVGIEIKNQSCGSFFNFRFIVPSDEFLENYRNELNMLDG